LKYRQIYPKANLGIYRWPIGNWPNIGKKIFENISIGFKKMIPVGLCNEHAYISKWFLHFKF